jgi:alkylation response protein AidB-like acyl-CoA dehydrogenase
MDFGLSEDQRLLEASARAFVRDRAPIARVRELRGADCPNDRAIWRGLAELGAAGILVPEPFGGSGLELLDAALVAQSLGHAATPSPFLSTGVIAPVALAAFGADAKTWLEGIASGELVIGAAFTEQFSVREGAGIVLEAGRLRGKALMALDAHGADRILVPIGSDRLVVVRADAKGVSIASTARATRSRARSTRAASRSPPTRSARASR